MTDATFDSVAADGLAALILGLTSASLNTDLPESVGEAIVTLSRDAMLPLDLAAGILLATTALAAGGQLGAGEVATLAEVYESQTTEGAQPNG